MVHISGKIHFIAWLICKSLMYFDRIYEMCDILKPRLKKKKKKSNKLTTLMNNMKL